KDKIEESEESIQIVSINVPLKLGSSSKGSKTTKDNKQSTPLHPMVQKIIDTEK
ncbi:hypothetical protein Mgra_00003822, partial [Meloidogyne graminicola]